MKPNRKLIKGGCVITMNSQTEIYNKADVLIENDRIAAIAPALEIEDCAVVNAEGMIVMPGLIDTHRHIWQSTLKATAADYTLMQYLQQILGVMAPRFRPEDVYRSNLLGAVEALNAGITTVLDWSHIMNTPLHADAAIEGLQESGARVVFAHGNPGTNVWEWFYESQKKHPLDIERISSQYFNSNDGLVTLAMAIRGPEYSSFDVTAHDLALARKLSIPVSMHVGCGTFAAKYKAIHQLHKAGLLGPDLNFAHCNYLSTQDLAVLKQFGCTISITPEVEMQMGLGMPATGKAWDAGLTPGLGIDVATAVSGDLFTQMRFALQVERAFANEAVLLVGEMPQKLSRTTSDALRMATINGAKTLWMDHKTGSLEVGKQADIILLKNLELAALRNPIAMVVQQAGVANVDTVLVAGKTVKQNGKLLVHNMGLLREKAEATCCHLLQEVEQLEAAR
jgi:5-methylthioadenosine/S-adenosylhomocysteine deaminase